MLLTVKRDAVHSREYADRSERCSLAARICSAINSRSVRAGGIRSTNLLTSAVLACCPCRSISSAKAVQRRPTSSRVCLTREYPSSGRTSPERSSRDGLGSLSRESRVAASCSPVDACFAIVVLSAADSPLGGIGFYSELTQVAREVSPPISERRLVAIAYRCWAPKFSVANFLTALWSLSGGVPLGTENTML